MRASKHTAICIVLAAVALSSSLFFDRVDRDVIVVTYEPLVQSAPTMTHAERANRIRSAILALAEKHRTYGDRERLRQLADTIYHESRAEALDPLLVAAIISMESSFRPAVVSEAGAIGLMQLRPFVAQDVAERHDLLWSGDITLVEPNQNVRLGVRYYRELVDRFQGDERLALIAYNRGPTRLRHQMRNSGAEVASSYAENVLRLYQQLCEDCGLLQA
ncbi:MAG: lytic transglycosylase domain-containing protein [Acidobacteria bacterium]|uniref:Lytic transglycosylase domain-containing protein n=1 Tax=Candidatus Polarisedimenticola svalbardensis TaxID=2886004 RepID=A0A8J7CCH3_9BACT|nr:lytic transglycosylase domain-containing protein [Candidatus Polarisedimenticola svalbardensis]